MPVRVTSGNSYRISVNRAQSEQTVRSVAIATALEGATVNIASTLAGLSDVNATDSDNNEVLVWDANENKYVIKVLPEVDGGIF